MSDYQWPEHHELTYERDLPHNPMVGRSQLMLHKPTGQKYVLRTTRDPIAIHQHLESAAQAGAKHPPFHAMNTPQGAAMLTHHGPPPAPSLPAPTPPAVEPPKTVLAAKVKLKPTKVSQPTHVHAMVAQWDKNPQPNQTLHGTPLQSASEREWHTIPNSPHFEEPPMPDNPQHKWVSTGVIYHEPDGRVWGMEPKDHFGGINHQFPKGKLEEHLTPQQNALKEGWEETGIHGDLTHHLFDHESPKAITRFYLGKRTGGAPWDASWEAHNVKLMHPDFAREVFENHRDSTALDKLMAHPAYTPGPDLGKSKGSGPGRWGAHPGATKGAKDRIKHPPPGAPDDGPQAHVHEADGYRTWVRPHGSAFHAYVSHKDTGHVTESAHPTSETALNWAHAQTTHHQQHGAFEMEKSGIRQIIDGMEALKKGKDGGWESSATHGPTAHHRQGKGFSSSVHRTWDHDGNTRFIGRVTHVKSGKFSESHEHNEHGAKAYTEAQAKHHMKHGKFDHAGSQNMHEQFIKRKPGDFVWDDGN